MEILEGIFGKWNIIAQAPISANTETAFGIPEILRGVVYIKQHSKSSIKKAYILSENILGGFSKSDIDITIAENYISRS